jgi:hypothetical protein
MGRLGDGPASGHPSIAISQSNLVLVLKDLGDVEEARDLLEKAYATARSPGWASTIR